MAQVVKKLTVCDVGLEKCDNDNLHRGRVTLDGKTKAFVLCTQHAKPLVAMMEGASARPSRARVYSMTEVTRKKKA